MTSKYARRKSSAGPGKLITTGIARQTAKVIQSVRSDRETVSQPSLGAASLAPRRYPYPGTVL